MTTVSTQVSPACPLCGTPAARVHSRYLRQLADLPCGGQQVRLLVQVRKCFCDVPNCARKIFAERLTSFADAFARVTKRLYQIVQVIGLATGGRRARACHGSPEHPDQPDDHSPTHYGAA
jgi:transposase